MKKLAGILLILLAAGLFSAAYAQDRSLLYEVSGKNLKQPSYLFGMFHLEPAIMPMTALLCFKDLQLTDVTLEAFAKAKRVYLETNIGGTDPDPAQAKVMIRAITLRDGKTLKDLLSPDDYITLDTNVRQELGVDLSRALNIADAEVPMVSLKPLFLMWMLVIYGEKCEPTAHIVEFAKLAEETDGDKKDLLGLELFEEQAALLDKIPIDKQLKGLVDMARSPDEARKERATLLAAYKTQDVDQFTKLIRESRFVAETEGFAEELLDKRNVKWIPVIEKAATERSTFFAFGAGHLGGANGVLSLLRQKGYTVEGLPPGPQPPAPPTAPVPVVTNSPALESPVLITPIDLALLPSPERESWRFDWEDIPKTSKYQIVVTAPGVAAPIIDAESRSSQYVSPARRVSNPGRNSRGWTWKVRAQTANGSWGPWSESRVFDVVVNEP